MARLRWDREGQGWPNHAASRFVEAAGLRWHVQRAGSGPVLLLLHGTGASAHSWRDMIMPLASRFTVIAPDLPGHGFTAGRLAGGPSLPRIAMAVRELLAVLEADPAMIVGHSAGAAIALEVARFARVPVVGLSAALLPFPGLAAQLFPAMAKVLFVNPLVPSIFARLARGSGETERFLRRSTSSRIDATGLGCYQVLLGNSEHCAGALAMMASWDLAALRDRLRLIESPVLLVHGTHDPAIPVASVRSASELIPNCQVELLEGLGHLAHEERPSRAIELVMDFAARQTTQPEQGAR